jgi:hypothetical protein
VSAFSFQRESETRSVAKLKLFTGTAGVSPASSSISTQTR